MAGTTSAGASSASSGGDGGVKDQAQEKAQEVREQAGAQMRQARGQARERVREQGKDGPARMVDQVADRAERAGSWLTESDADRILGDVEDFARSNPWAVAAGGLALGFAASRMLKASSSRRYWSEQGARNRSYPGETAYPPQPGPEI